MNTSPSIDDLLAGVIAAIDDDIVPALANPKAHATAAMMQSLLQGVRQLLPVYDAYLVDEHNDMTRVLRAMAAELETVDGEAADRVRSRASTLGQLPDLPPPLDRSQLMAAHRELSQALEVSLIDLDELQRAGHRRADAALEVLRGHLGPRYLRDVDAFTVEGGMLGRG